MQEYLVQRGLSLPEMLQKSLNYTKPDSLPAQAAASAMTMGAEQLAKKFICGSTVEEAVKTISQLRKKKLTFSVDLLGEAIISETEAERYVQRYLELLTLLSQAAKSWGRVALLDGEELPKVSISVKLSALFSQFDPLNPQETFEKVQRQLKVLFQKAAETGAFVHIDMEQYAYKDLTYTIIQDLLMQPEYRNLTQVGMTIQAYLQDSYEDAEKIIAWAKQRGTRFTVRLVKGAYWDQEVIKAKFKDSNYC
jgi:RHH-type proline utilization regulon transcriptional repressor/proline dehydrogenase/delta 1-pyrroline-5-carboxylate dehydrogenase